MGIPSSADGGVRIGSSGRDLTDKFRAQQEPNQDTTTGIQIAAACGDPGQEPNQDTTTGIRIAAACGDPGQEPNQDTTTGIRIAAACGDPGRMHVHWIWLSVPLELAEWFEPSKHAYVSYERSRYETNGA
jgi:hypothetical protein